MSTPLSLCLMLSAFAYLMGGAESAKLVNVDSPGKAGRGSE